MKSFLTCLLSCALTALALHAAPKDDVVLQAMRDELARSTAQLQLENLEKPYFIAYRVEEQRNQAVSANFGSLNGDHDSRYRQLTVEVRVGTPAFDNSNFISTLSSGQGRRTMLPCDDNYTEIRRQLWLATDDAYKDAIETLSKKKAAIQNKTRTDETPDFSPQKPETITDLHPGKPLDMAQARALVRELSLVFRECPAVATSAVSIRAADELTRYINSEGTSFVTESAQLMLEAQAGTQASDGFPLDDHFVLIRRNWADLPAKSELTAAVRELGARLAQLRDAPLLEQYNGPVLFEAQAAPEIFAQVFASQLVARKRPISDNPAYESFLAGQENIFLDKLGARVLPDFLSVTDNATITQLGAAPLFGDAKVDDEGVPTRAVQLIEKGRLKTLLVSRSPVRGVSASTGSTRGGSPALSNLIVASSEGQTPAELKAQLLKLVQLRGKEYGVIVRRIGNPMFRIGQRTIRVGARSGETRVEPAILAYKVFPDGREELLRNVEIGGMNAQLFKDIVAAGNEPVVHTIPFRSTALFATGIPVVSFAVPALLFEDVTLKKPTGEIPKPQLAKHPYFDK
ncbi:MAG: hypothetical protein HZA31_01500 [Opitutae bacterium]|nr:hypothetical protein [Opitutae bacterium]